MIININFHNYTFYIETPTYFIKLTDVNSIISEYKNMTIL